MTSGVPDFIVAGTARSGTTAVADTLRDHPEVFVTTPKEPHYLGLGRRAPAYTGPGDAETITRAVVVEEADYLRLFEPAQPGQIRGDGSSSSLYFHEAAIPVLQRLNPDVKVVILLREPLARAYSAYQYQQMRGFETATFAEALAAEDQRIADGWHHIWHYRRMGEYTPSVKAYLDAFGREQVGVWFYDDIERDAGAVLRDVLAHIGATPDATDREALRRINVSGEARSELMQRGIHALTRQVAVREAIKKVLPYRAREAIRRLNLKPTGLPTDVGAELRESLRPDAVALEELLGRPVPWRS